MDRWRLSLLFGVSLAIGLLAVRWDLEASAQSEPAPTGDAAIERGRYIVHEVAMCVQCHSPRTESGGISSVNLMRGAPIPIEGPRWTDAWAYLAPDVVALARGRADYVVEILTTGKRPDGSVPKLPMPPFRLDEADARAVVAYLKTLR